MNDKERDVIVYMIGLCNGKDLSPKESYEILIETMKTKFNCDVTQQEIFDLIVYFGDIFSKV